MSLLIFSIRMADWLAGGVRGAGAVTGVGVPVPSCSGWPSVPVGGGAGTGVFWGSVPGNWPGSIGRMPPMDRIGWAAPVRVPGAIAAGAFAFLAYQLAGATLILLPAVIVALVVAGECWLAVEGLGRVLDRTDPSAVEASE